MLHRWQTNRFSRCFDRIITSAVAMSRKDLQSADPAEHEPPSADSPAEGQAWVDLASFSNPEYDLQRGMLVRTAWYFVSVLVFESGWFPLSRLKTSLLRLFGAGIGEGVVVKPHVRIKYPWRLVVGDHCWIGQGTWIDNIENVSIGSHVCVSQLTYLCTGSHNYRVRTFDLDAREIRVADGAWLGARCLILGGVTVGANALVTAGSVVNRDVEAAAIVRGNPATPLKRSRERPT